MKVGQKIKKSLLMKTYDSFITDFPGSVEKTVEKIRPVAERVGYKGAMDEIEKALSDPDNNWVQLIKNAKANVDEDVLRTFFENFIVNANFLWSENRQAAEEQYGCNIPWTILIDPTSACNLQCLGCWAAEYEDKANLSFETLDSIIEQGKELNMRFFLYSGGEPLVRKQDIVSLCNKHSDCYFLAFTNGTLIDEAFAEDMLRVKNFIPAISIEGSRETTDARRGKGTYDKVQQAVRILREKKLPFGFSCTYTRENTDVLSSSEFFDWMVEQGGLFAWFFTFMPVGVNSPTDLMVTAEQRKQMHDAIRAYRYSKAIFTLDFWNDGEYVNGCIAGGRKYLHINANGDIEPCAFIHYSDSNIREQRLLEALKNPLFMAYKEGQPFNQNHLRPCPLLDNKDALAEIVHRTNAKSTDFKAPEAVDDLCGKCHAAADHWAVVADEMWAEKADRKKSSAFKSKL